MPERDNAGLNPNRGNQSQEPDPDRITPPVDPRTRMEIGPRDGSGGLLPTLETRERDRAVYDMKINRGLTWQQIADELGYADPSGPWYAFKRVLNAIPKAISEDAKDHEIAHLEMLRARVLALLDEKYYTVQGGKVVFDPYTERPLHDRSPVLAAIDRLVKIEERIAHLQGLNSQNTAVVVANVNYTIDGVDMEKLK